MKKWLKHYPEEIISDIMYDEKPLQTYLEESAQQYDENVALNFMGKNMSFVEVYEQAKKFANFIQMLGLEKGDRVAIMLPNCPQAVISYYGVLLAGGIVVQTNPLYKERELLYQLKNSGSTIIICLDILLPLVSSIKQSTLIKHTIVTQIKDYLPFPKNKIYPWIQKREYKILVKVEENHETHVWQKIMENTSTKFSPVEIDPLEDLALLQYTGGTTGNPKGVMLTHYNLVTNVQMCQAWLYKIKKGEEVILGVLPFFHVYGMTTVMNLSIMLGAKMVLLPKFNVKTTLRTIHKEKPTLFPGAPTIYVALLNDKRLKKYDLSSIKACISGSAPLPLEIQKKFEEITGGKLVEGYGLTETSPVTHANFLWTKRVHGSIGVPWPNTDAKIIDIETDTEADIGEIGEIVVKGPQIMKGYWNNAKDTDQVLRDGWLYTGDLGYMDEAGYFYIVDRKGDMIIAGGFNIYPREIEEVLYEHEGILEAAVAGIPDPYRGETVKAFVVLRPNYKVTEESLNAYCRKHLAAFKVPKLYEFRDVLPKTTIGKVLRRELIKDEAVHK